MSTLCKIMKKHRDTSNTVRGIGAGQILKNKQRNQPLKLENPIFQDHTWNTIKTKLTK